MVLDDNIDCDVDNNGQSELITISNGGMVSVDAGVYEDCDVQFANISDVESSIIKLAGDTATLTAMLLDLARVPSGYNHVYLLSLDGRIVASSDSIHFDVDTAGRYCIHSLVYDPRPASPNYINVEVIIRVSLLVDDLQGLIVQNDRCASLDATGKCIEIGACGSLGDYVWYDANANGIQDGGEAGMNNIEITLLDTSGNPIDTMVTSNVNGKDGHYKFKDLSPGTYYLSADLPWGMDFSDFQVGSNEEIDNDGNHGRGKGGSRDIMLTSGKK